MSPGKASYADLETRCREAEALVVDLRARLSGMAGDDASRCRIAVEKAVVGVWFIGDDGTISYVNESLARMIGCAPSEMLGCRPEEFVVGGDVRGFATHLETQAADGEEPRQISMKRRDGSILCVLASGRPLTDTGDDVGSAAGCFGMFTDITRRQAREEERREEDERFRRIVSTTPDHVVVQDAQLRYRMVVNPQLGLTEAGMIGRTDHEILAREDADKLARIKQHVFDTGMPIAVEESVLSLGGVREYFEGSFIPTRGANGKVDGLIGRFRNVTARRNAEERLRVSEERLRLAHKAANDVVWDWDIAKDEQVWNEAGAVAFGWTDIVEKPQTAGWWVERLHPADRDRVHDVFAAVLDDPAQTSWHDEYRFRKADGSYAQVMDRGFVVRDAAGRAVRMIGAMLDITERKQAEEKARASGLLLREMQSIARLGGWTANPLTDFLEWTDGVRAIIEVPQGYQPGLNEGLGFYPPEEAARIKEHVTRCLSTGEPFRGEYQVRTATGKELWAEVRGIAPIIEGDRAYVVGTFQDITERKRAEEDRDKLNAQLAQAQRLESIGRLAGGVAHDFNNMLQVILGHKESALAQTSPAEPLRADLERIGEAAERSADLTRQLLAFARRQSVAPRVIDLDRTVDAMLRMLRRLMGEDIELIWAPGGGPVAVRIDPSQIDQVLANLCLNARDAIKGVGRVVIETGAATFDDADCLDDPELVPGCYALLAVTDDGCGIDPAALSRLFEPFFSTKELGKGTGLGLATVYGIVKQNGGLIKVESEPLRGSCFRIYLPLHDGTIEQATAPAGIDPGAGGDETILVVEDEPAILSLARTMLERRGYLVLTAHSPAEALDLAQRHVGPIHMLVTDVIMPKMNGRDLASRISERRPGLKRLFMSGHTAEFIDHRDLLGPGASFIEKPFSMRDFALKIRGILDQA